MTVAVNGQKKNSIQSELIKGFFCFLSLMLFLGKQLQFCNFFFFNKPFAFGIIPYRRPQQHKWYENKKYISNHTLRTLVATNKPTAGQNDDITATIAMKQEPQKQRDKMGVKCAKHYSSLSLKTVFLNSFYRACERKCAEKQIGDPLHKGNDDIEGSTQCVNLSSRHSPLQNLRRSQMHVQRSVDRSVDQKLVSIYTICIKTAASNNDPLKLDVVKSCAVS